MLFIKANPDIVNEQLIDTSIISCDVQESVYELDMLCADFAFECTHMQVKEYHVLLEESNNAEVDKSSTSTNTTVWEKIKGFISRIVSKVRELFTKFINWATTKIISNDKFIAQYKDKKLGTITAEAYNYKMGFERIKTINKTVSEAFNVVKNAFDEIKATGKHTGSDELQAIIDDAKKNLDRIVSIGAHNGSRTFDQIQKDAKKNSEEYHKGYFAGVKTAMIGKKEERKLDGYQLLKILEANKDIKTTLQKVNVGVLETLKYMLKHIDSYKTGNTPIETRILIQYAVNLNAKIVQVTITAAQELIIGIRSHITQCAKAAEQQ